MPPSAMQTSQDIVSRAESVLTEIDIESSPYFASLVSGDMSHDSFCRGQRQFYFAVNFFSRPMSALMMRLDTPEQRLGILANVLEEHGDFQPSAFHEATFRQFLALLADDDRPVESEMRPPVHAFNSTIMSACLTDEVEVGIACLGIIEYAFADISAIIGRAVVDRGWLAEDQLVHYSLHAEIDKQHAADFFKLIDSCWGIPAKRESIERGLRLGGYAFDRLYRDLND